MEENTVVIVGAGPAGIATSACLNRLSIPNVVFEREDCSASLWKKRCYDSLKLNLPKQFCQLPYKQFPSYAPTYLPKDSFVQYLDKYVSYFGVIPRYLRSVESADYDSNAQKWCIVVKNMANDASEVFMARFLVVATGENSQELMPRVRGLDTFKGDFMHSSQYKNGKQFNGKNVLVVGWGTSGAEIAFDLLNCGAKPSIVARTPVHVLSKEIVHMGMVMLKYLPCKVVDNISVMLSKVKYGNVSKYGLKRPKRGPFYLKATTGQSPVIDVGTIGKIKKGEIQVFPTMAAISDKTIVFDDGKRAQFDAIIFATGYKSTVRNWLKGSNRIFDENGMPQGSFPDHWKGENGLYCAGFDRGGLQGISVDAQNIARDISAALGLDGETS
ncbi:Pyridine nucleotide-disulfide oxidoreductase, class-II [Corchorus olitorius]|uniref:Flavin-containing monooxygenase n=1 Tax=Corchorus olitorius TaxID=93759 RepID=A0A1R3I8B2_9ROSI|nr:Pyridine nucleotide-disulfide oxidoreductase, class-II [Corchorus olitorius]